MKLYLYIAVFSAVWVITMAIDGFKCYYDSDCDKNECCAGASRKRSGRCAWQPSLDEKCQPGIGPANTKYCRCPTGLTCALYRQNRITFTCQKVVLLPDEEEEKTNTRLSLL